MPQMNSHQQAAIIDLLELHRAIKRLQSKAINLRAAHWQTLNISQRDMVTQAIAFAYADSRPIITDIKSGDGLFWTFDKFLEVGDK